MTLASVASDAAFAWLSIRSCPGSAVETNGTANDSSSSDSSSCGQYPILLFVATAVVGAVSYRQSSFSPSRSRGPLNHALAFVVVYLLFAFCGSIAANLFLGRAPASLVPREEYRFAYAVVWAVFGVFLSDRSIRSFDERLGLSGFLKFLAALDAATTSFNVVHAAHAKGLPFLACLFAGCLVGCAGYFVRELAVVPSGNLNLARTAKNFLGYISVQLVFVLLFYWVPLHEPIGEWAYCGLTLALSVITSFEDTAGRLFLRDFVARAMRRLIWQI